MTVVVWVARQWIISYRVGEGGGGPLNPLVPNWRPCHMHLFSLKAKAPCPFQLIPAGTLQRNVVSLTQRGGSVVPIRPRRSLGNIVARTTNMIPDLIGRCNDTIPLHSWILHVGLPGIRHDPAENDNVS